ncbi:MAG TPA: hypothetical protein VL551_35630 [Actinospica sp.]|nr:hypothetical protein [Actinospica sp.]
MTTTFGCPHCYAEDLPAADADDHKRYELDTNLEDDSHFIVSILRCRACGQHFISIFTEYVDWEYSEDDQYRTLMPLTEQEAADLRSRAASVHDVGDLGRTRRYVESSWPSRTAKTIRWTSGAFEVREGR